MSRAKCLKALLFPMAISHLVMAHLAPFLHPVYPIYALVPARVPRVSWAEYGTLAPAPCTRTLPLALPTSTKVPSRAKWPSWPAGLAA